VTTASLAMFCSVLFQKTASSMMASYVIIIVFFMGPPALEFFATTFFPDSAQSAYVHQLTALSPFAAAFSLPLSADGSNPELPGDVSVFTTFVGVYVVLDLALLLGMLWQFERRWRVAT